MYLTDNQLFSSEAVRMKVWKKGVRSPVSIGFTVHSCMIQMITILKTHGLFLSWQKSSSLWRRYHPLVYSLMFLPLRSAFRVQIIQKPRGQQFLS